MTLTFRGIREQVFVDTFLNTANFSELVEFTPVGGTPRDIVVHLEPESDYQVIDTQTGEQMDQLVVLASKNPSATGSDGRLRGGIDQARIGDRIVRRAVVDARQEPYTFTGIIRENHQYKWRLEFRRRARPDQGVPRD